MTAKKEAQHGAEATSTAAWQHPGAELVLPLGWVIVLYV